MTATCRAALGSEARRRGFRAESEEDAVRRWVVDATIDDEPVAT